EDGPHHGMPGPVDLPPAARIGGQLGGAPHTDRRPGTPIGVWCATKLATDAGGWQQVNRAGHPMMWPIFWPDDTRFTYPANTRHPSADFAQDGKHLAGLITAAVAAAGTTGDPEGYGQIVASALFPDV